MPVQLCSSSSRCGRVTSVIIGQSSRYLPDIDPLGIFSASNNAARFQNDAVNNTLRVRPQRSSTGRRLVYAPSHGKGCTITQQADKSISHHAAKPRVELIRLFIQAPIHQPTPREHREMVFLLRTQVCRLTKSPGRWRERAVARRGQSPYQDRRTRVRKSSLISYPNQQARVCYAEQESLVLLYLG